MADNKRLLSLVGLATRARKVVSGEFSTEKSVKSGKSHLVIVSEEASDNTKKKFTNMCTYYKVPIYLFGQRTNWGMPWAGVQGVTVSGGCRFRKVNGRTNEYKRR